MAEILPASKAIESIPSIEICHSMNGTIAFSGHARARTSDREEFNEACSEQ